MRYLLPEKLFDSSQVTPGTPAPDVDGAPSWEPRGALYGGGDEEPPTGTGTYVMTGTNSTAVAGPEGIPICLAIKGST